MANILVFGDSNTHGTLPHAVLGQSERLPRGARWPDIMADLTGHDVVAEGLGGRTTVHEDIVEGGKRSGSDVLPAILLSHVPLDLMVILLGTNDLKNRFSVSAVEIAHSVRRLVTEARWLVPGLDVMILSPIPVREVGSLREVFAGAEARQQGLAGHLERVAEDADCGFLDLAPVGAVSELDGVHWTAETHTAVGRAVAKAITARIGAGS